jgi:biopolymer transport protein ExbB/TolQ
MLYKILVEGGIFFMLPIYIIWVVSIVLIALLAYRLFAKDSAKLNKSKSLSELILFLGSFTFLWGILGQVIGMLEALTVIQAVGDISPALIAGGIKVSLYAPTSGFVLFFITFIAWYIARRLRK